MDSEKIKKELESKKIEYSKMGLSKEKIELLIELDKSEIRESIKDSIESEKNELLKRLNEIKEKEKELGIKKSRGKSGGNKKNNFNYFKESKFGESIIPNSILHIFHDSMESFNPRGLSIKKISEIFKELGINGDMIINEDISDSENQRIKEKIKRIRFSESKIFQSMKSKIEKSESFKFYRMNLKNKENIRFKDFQTSLELE